ncbi:MAG: hypothetical protein J6D34_06490 [Atopobiaceae bacterium]|nr:hypothetical protein [Atopobiaceae bacterium]
MNVYVQGFSALAHYRSSSATTRIERCPASVRNLADATSSQRIIADMKIWRLGIEKPCADHPLEVLVRTREQRSRSKAVVARIWKSPLAPTAFRQVASNIYVSSPEFVFLQLATKLDLPELVALGMEFCGTYRRDVEVGGLDPDATGHITIYHQPPLSTPKRLRGFLNVMKSAPGSARAIKALDYVLPNSASPMETSLYLLLCLPRRLGGYALPKPMLNPPIVLSKAGRRHTLRNSAKPDLYWKDIKLDLEFNSTEFHDENSRASDSMRRKALERMGVEVIELTSTELFDTRLFHATVLRLALRFNKQLRPENEGAFAERRALLRRRLLIESTTKDTEKLQFGMTEDGTTSSSEGRWLGESDSLEWTEDPSTWAQESVDDESWVNDYMDSDDSWFADVFDSTGEEDDGDLRVFGSES